ncbi:uncharacterized protein LOC119722957 [Patiria miniata]|uniref:Uncharacterized protein n=1 Tax=Patiria miniata TaxID=46514 RepID=A0A913ZE21_PATMI|nr:uncharacterized protein LOC119722957 [Patiria miniata]
MQLMALSRIICGCLLLLFVGLIWIPILFVHNSENDVDITVLAADVVDIRTLSTPGEGNYNLERSGKISKILKTLHEIKDKGIITTDIIATNTLETDQPMNVVDVSTTWLNEEWSARDSDVQHIVTARSNQSNAEWIEQVSYTMLSTHNGTTTSTCNQMAYLRKTTFRWIKVLCEVLKRQPPVVRVGLLAMVVLTSLILTIIGYKLMCPGVHHREGIERHYDMEDSWLMFA